MSLFELDTFIPCHHVEGNMRQMSIESIGLMDKEDRPSDPHILITIQGDDFGFPGKISQRSFRQAVEQSVGTEKTSDQIDDPFSGNRIQLRKVKFAEDHDEDYITYLWVGTDKYLLRNLQDEELVYVRIKYLTTDNTQGEAFVPFNELRLKLQ